MFSKPIKYAGMLLNHTCWLHYIALLENDHYIGQPNGEEVLWKMNISMKTLKILIIFFTLKMPKREIWKYSPCRKTLWMMSDRPFMIPSVVSFNMKPIFWCINFWIYHIMRVWIRQNTITALIERICSIASIPCCTTVRMNL